MCNIELNLACLAQLRALAMASGAGLGLAQLQGVSARPGDGPKQGCDVDPGDKKRILFNSISITSKCFTVSFSENTISTYY